LDGVLEALDVAGNAGRHLAGARSNEGTMEEGNGDIPEEADNTARVNKLLEGSHTADEGTEVEEEH